jgi:hypothetical protein
MPKTNDRAPARHNDRIEAWMKWGGRGLVLLGVVLVVVWVVGLAQTALSLRQHLAQVQALADDPRSLDPATACDLVLALRDDVVTLRRRAGGLDRLGPAFGWVPKVGGDLRAAPSLLIVADGLTEAGALGCDAMGPAMAALGSTGEDSAVISPEYLVGLLSEERSDLEQALAAVQRARRAWIQVDQASLSAWTAGKTALLDRALPLLQAGLSAATIAPDLLGVDEPRTYLVLALNEDELRPGGGFITGVGEVRVEAGQLITMTFRDSYAVDDFTLPYPLAPEPMQRFMGIGLWVFRDSNWSPDFPTAARRAISLYRPGYPVTVDGVVALDQRAVQQIVNAVGPLTLEGVEEPVTGDSIIPYIRQALSPQGEDEFGEWWRQRKSFMGVVASTAWQQVQRGQVDWATLGWTLFKLLDEKHLLVYLAHPEAAALLAEQGWDGALASGPGLSEAEGPGDFLMVVDANVGYNKANARVDEEIIYQVDLESSPPEAVLTLVYTHTGTVDVPCVHEPVYGSTYEDMMDRCYWYYVRAYTPEGSEFLETSPVTVSGQALITGKGYPGDVVVREAEEGPWLAFGVLGLLQPSLSQERVFTWTLPIDVVQWHDDEGHYTLRIQKQPGTLGHQLTVRARLPEGGELIETAPKPATVQGDWITYRTTLDRDREFRLRFGRQTK